MHTLILRMNKKGFSIYTMKFYYGLLTPKNHICHIFLIFTMAITFNIFIKFPFFGGYVKLSTKNIFLKLRYKALIHIM